MGISHQAFEIGCSISPFLDLVIPVTCSRSQDKCNFTIFQTRQSVKNVSLKSDLKNGFTGKRLITENASPKTG